jgi:hypothetical protein
MKGRRALWKTRNLRSTRTSTLVVGVYDDPPSGDLGLDRAVAEYHRNQSSAGPFAKGQPYCGKSHA